MHLDGNVSPFLQLEKLNGLRFDSLFVCLHLGNLFTINYITSSIIERCRSSPAGVRTVQRGAKSPSGGGGEGQPRPMVLREWRVYLRSGVVDGSGWWRLLLCGGRWRLRGEGGTLSCNGEKLSL
jgi:hypothetical protein